jgi:hypothetical protein
VGLRNHGHCIALWHAALTCEKRHSFLNFSYVCPEPVLVKCSVLYINGAKSGVFRTERKGSLVCALIKKQTKRKRHNPFLFEFFLLFLILVPSLS